MGYVSVGTLKAGDDTTSNSIIKAFAQHSAFSSLSVAETNDILARRVHLHRHLRLHLHHLHPPPPTSTTFTTSSTTSSMTSTFTLRQGR